MASRRPRSGARVSKKSDERPDEGTPKRKKRKIGDLLGPVWTKEELKRFYDAYRKYGTDWKQVGASVPMREVEMVEALYNMNRAYLALPEGVASLEGLAAMMSDFYSVRGGSQSDEGGTLEVSGSLQSPQHQSRQSEDVSTADASDGRISNRMRASASLARATSSPSSQGAHSPVAGLSPIGFVRHVRKRTPRVSRTLTPNDEKNTQRKSGDSVAVNHKADALAAAVAAAAEQESFPSMQQDDDDEDGGVEAGRSASENGWDGYVKKSGGRDGGKKHHGNAAPKRQVIYGGGEMSRSSPLRGRNLMGTLTRCQNEGRGVGRQGGRGRGRGRKSLKIANEEDADGAVGSLGGKEAMDWPSSSSLLRSSPPESSGGANQVGWNKEGGPRGVKRSHRNTLVLKEREMSPEDPSNELNALRTLASLANGLLPSPREREGDEKETAAKADGVQSLSLPSKGEFSRSSSPQLSFGATQPVSSPARPSRRRQGSQTRRAPKKDGVKRLGRPAKNARTRKVEEVVKELNGAPGDAKTVGGDAGAGRIALECKDRDKETHNKGCASSEDVPQKANAMLGNREADSLASPPVGRRRNRKSLSEKLPENPSGNQTSSVQKAGSRARRAPQVKTSAPVPEVAAVTVAGQVQEDDTGALPLKLRKKKKSMPSKSALAEEECVSEHGEKVPGACSNGTAGAGAGSSTKAKLMHCLHLAKARRWTMYEWFCSAIDLPWFSRNAFVEYLEHAGLAHVTKLTRCEWGVIRSSLGKPRRLSRAYLAEEREKLEAYREAVRQQFQDLRKGSCDALPPDMPRPLCVGQRVIARHPRTRQVHDGSVLTVDRTRCRIQFDRPELGVEHVQDIDTMPLNPLENMSEMMRRRKARLGHSIEHLEAAFMPMAPMLRQPIVYTAEGAARASLHGGLEMSSGYPSEAANAQWCVSTLAKRAQILSDNAETVEAAALARSAAQEAAEAAQAAPTVPLNPQQAQAREADINALVELTGALDKKIAMLVALKHMNEDAAPATTEDWSPSKDFQRQYATVVLQLRGVNKEIEAALVELRNRTNGPDSLMAPWHRAAPADAAPSGMNGSADNNPPIGEMAAAARRQARAMVAKAVQAMAQVKDGEDELVILTQALGSPGNATSGSPGDAAGGTESNAQADTLTTPDRANGRVVGKPPAVPADPLVGIAASFGASPGVKGGYTKEAGLLSELMASCVATLLMVQTCTERLLPQSDVVLMLDSALASLRPHSTLNQHIYRDIERSINLLKSHIVSHLPVST